MLNKKYYHINILAVVMTAVILLLTLAGCGDTNKFENNEVSDLQDSARFSEQGSDAGSDQPGTDQLQSGKESASLDNGSGLDGARDSEKAFPKKVTDAGGFEMTINSEPQRIVSLNLGADEILLDLVDSSRIASLTRYVDDEGISNIASRSAGIGERTTMDMIENIIALKPDLVFLDTWAEAGYVKQLRDAGICVYAFKTPNNIDEQKAVILELAHVVGADTRGEEIIAWMDEKLKAVEEKLSRLEPDQKLTVMDYGELGSSGLGTNFDDIVTRAGLINVVSQAGIEGWPVISKEKMIEFDPDVIILPSWYYDEKNSFEGMKNSLKSDQALQTVSAIREDRIISVPNPHISAISQYVVLGVEDVARAAYPELFE